MKFKSKETLGIIFAIFAYFSFSILDALQKTAVIHYSIFQLLFIKYTFVLLLSLIEAKRAKNNNFYRSNNLKLQIIRSLLSILESGFFVLSFKHLSLANAHSIGALAPIIIVVLSVFILNEKVSMKTWIAIFAGFIGVLIIIRPASDVFSVNSFIPLLAAFFLGLYQIATKKTTEYDAPEVSLFYSSLVGIIITSIMAFNFWQPINFNSIFLFVPIGLFFSLGIYFQIIALKNARASIIQPFHYTLIFWAIIFGFFFYDDIPDLFTIIGAIIITTSGIFVINQTSKK
tara:strand:- start:308 stop:1168 length:861 start_codon:yes stop_codon:yes gene_type:complete